MENFRELRVWQLAKEVAVRIYKLSNDSKFSKDYGLRDQVQRSAVSIASNIAEGDEMGSDKQSIRHFFIAKGSAAELMTQIIIANEIGYIEPSISDKLIDDCDKISAMLSKLIRSRDK